MAKNPWEMTDAELAEYIEQMKQELAKRQSLEAVRVQIGDAIKEARAGGVLEAPEPGAEYTVPGDTTQLCVQGDIATVNGETWVLERGSCIGPPSVENGWVRTEDATD